MLSILLASFAAVLILFTLPIIFLGMVSPFAIRLATVADATVIAAMSRDLIESGLGWGWQADRVVRAMGHSTSGLAAAKRVLSSCSTFSRMPWVMTAKERVPAERPASSRTSLTRTPAPSTAACTAAGARVVKESKPGYGAALMAGINLVVDLIYVLLDPRIRVHA